MLKLFVLSVRMCIAFALLIQGALFAGRQALPTGIVQFHLLDCLPPCWIGITPGASSIEQAKARIVAVFGAQPGMTIKDSGFADGYVAPNVVENDVEGEDFFLYIRLTVAGVVDGRNEIVESIGLSGARAGIVNTAPTVVDILGTFGAPEGVVIQELLSGPYEITLQYPGLYAVFSTSADRFEYSQNPRLYFGTPPVEPLAVQYSWKRFRLFLLRQ